MTPVERIERLVRDGAVDREEGQRLLAAIDAQPAPSALRFLVNPFDRIGGGHAAAIGLAVSVLSAGIARFGIRFDGLLDLHFPHRAVPLRTALGDQVVAWIVPALVFYAYARLVARHVRFIDFLGMTGFARLPLLVVAPIVLPMAPLLVVRDPLHPPAMLLVFAAVMVVFVVLNVSLLYQGFKNASGLSGAKHVVGFIALVVGAEIVSKLALLLL